MKETGYTILQHQLDGMFGVFISVEGKPTGEALSYHDTEEDAESAVRPV